MAQRLHALAGLAQHVTRWRLRSLRGLVGTYLAPIARAPVLQTLCRPHSHIWVSKRRSSNARSLLSGTQCPCVSWV
jgi:hypothetical protein